MLVAQIAPCASAVVAATAPPAATAFSINITAARAAAQRVTCCLNKPLEITATSLSESVYIIWQATKRQQSMVISHESIEAYALVALIKVIE